MPRQQQFDYRTDRDASINLLQGLRVFSHFTTKWLGHVVTSLAAQEPISGTNFNVGALAYSGAFSYYAFKGAKQMLTPWHERNKWLIIDNRFKKSVTTVIKPVKISDLLKVTAPQELNDAALKTANDKATKTAADSAAAKAQVQLLKAIVDDQKGEDNIAHALEALKKAEEAAAQKAKEALGAKDSADKLAKNPIKDLDVTQKPPKPQSDKPAPVKAPAKNGDKKPEVKPEAKPDEDAFILTATLERKDKPSKDETHLPIPFTNESVIFKHKVFLDSCAKGSVGAVKFSIGALGALDNMDYIFLDDGYIQSRSVKNFFHIGPYLGTLASTIGGASRTVGQVAGKIVQGATYYDSSSFGLNNLVGIGAFGCGSYALYRYTDFTWFKLKTKPGESHFQTKTMGKDFLKLTGSIVCGSLSLLALDNFLSGGESRE